MTGQTTEPSVEVERTEPVAPPHVNTSEQVSSAATSLAARDAEQTAALRKLLGADPKDTTSAPTSTDDEYARAVTALKRDNVPQSVIDSHAQNPSLIKEWGLKAAKRQADTDSYGSKLTEMREKMLATPPAATAKAEPSAKVTDTDTPVDLSGLLGDEDTANAVRELVRNERVQSEQSLRAEFATQKFEVQVELAIAKATRNVDLDATIVAEKMAEISNRSPSGSFPNVQALAMEAVKQLTPANPKQSHGGQPSGKRSSPATSRPVTRDEQQEQYLRAYITQGKEQAERSIAR